MEGRRLLHTASELTRHARSAILHSTLWHAWARTTHFEVLPPTATPCPGSLVIRKGLFDFADIVRRVRRLQHVAVR